MCSLSSAWMYPAGTSAWGRGEGAIHLEAACNFRGPVGPDSSILHLFAGQSVPKSITVITASPPLECIHYVDIQTVPPAISAWCSHLRTNLFAHQKGGEGEDTNEDLTVSFVTVTLIFNPKQQHHAINGNAVREEIWEGPTKLHCILRLCGLNPIGPLVLNYLDIFENHSS